MSGAAGGMAGVEVLCTWGWDMRVPTAQERGEGIPARSSSAWHREEPQAPGQALTPRGHGESIVFEENFLVCVHA